MDGQVRLVKLTDFRVHMLSDQFSVSVPGGHGAVPGRHGPHVPADKRRNIKRPSPGIFRCAFLRLFAQVQIGAAGFMIIKMRVGSREARLVEKLLMLSKIEENEVIGLDDYVNKDNLYIFNAICKNNYELYSID